MTYDERVFVGHACKLVQPMVVKVMKEGKFDEVVAPISFRSPQANQYGIRTLRAWCKMEHPDWKCVTSAKARNVGEDGEGVLWIPVRFVRKRVVRKEAANA